MYVGIDDKGNIDGRYDDKNAKIVIEHFPEVVLYKVPDELAGIERGIYKYKVIEGKFVLKDDNGEFVEMNKKAIVNCYRPRRNELLTKTDWTQTADCALDSSVKERYKVYRQFLRDFPTIYDPQIDENGTHLDNYKLPETLEEFETSQN